MYSNGAMMGYAGTAIVAQMSKKNMIPVVVFSETYKFSKRAMLDSFLPDEMTRENRSIDGVTI